MNKQRKLYTHTQQKKTGNRKNYTHIETIENE